MITIKDWTSQYISNSLFTTSYKTLGELFQGKKRVKGATFYKSLLCYKFLLCNKMKVLIASVLFVALVAYTEAVATLEPKCPANYDMVQQEDGGCICECLELVRCGGNKEWDREVCNCECNLMCDEGETLDEVACACSSTPTTPPTRPQVQLRGECTSRTSAPDPRNDCSSFLTFRECRKHGCQWTRGQNRG